MQHLVSIIMPAYNAEKYIAESIRSVLDQTYQDWELIVVDDGSTDKTAQVVQSFSAQHARVKYIFQQNKKLAGARNTGIKNSQGELVAFLDSDDLWVRGKLEAQVKAISETDSDTVFSDAFYFPGDETSDESTLFSSFYGRAVGRFDGAAMIRLLLKGNVIPVLSVMTRKSTLDEVGRFDENPDFRGCEDYDLWFRLARHRAIFYGMDAVLARYRVHANAMSRNRAQMLASELSVIEAHVPKNDPERKLAQQRLKHVSRELMTALADDHRFDETGKCVNRLARWDRYGIVTQFQRALIRLMPRRYEYISQRLYILERHVRSIKDIRGQRTIGHVKGFWRKLKTTQA
jgi:teichuronic acid biosynthesis glycosyltransferase TuaG